ncbi:hypothetical protein SUGI_0742130 [Cryptomeria japonica]|uniref:CBS domain-containing protein CBSX1, chloroplastic n=1 Tax=Cryptomeria japonica TaxID=3369 RepID=UPI0024148265|nr:CBS domain-containing protein CBSX1, chloroplastic [Cryptomeria japonica]GLJ36793.1 hypothetical protein SUGI_0742130 [Cryptomeria japonica]
MEVSSLIPMASSASASASALSCCSCTIRLPLRPRTGKPRTVNLRPEQFLRQDQLNNTRLHMNVARSTLMANAVPPRQEVFRVGDFMTRKEHLFVVKPTTLVDEALEALVDNRITGLPVVDEDWTLVGVVSDYDLLALDSISGAGRTETGLFPQVDSTWKAFNELQNLLNKTNGKIVAEVMTPSPIVVRETTNLEDAARLLLETKHRRLPVVDNGGKLVGILTRGNVIRAALQMKRAVQQEAKN